MFHRHPFLSTVTGLYLGFVAWITLTPSSLNGYQSRLMRRALQELNERGYSLDYNRLEFLANIAMFVPIGMFLLLLFGAGGWWAAMAGTVAVTVLIETAQRGIPGRVSDSRDLIANTLGGLIGIAVALILTMPATLRRRNLRATPARA